MWEAPFNKCTQKISEASDAETEPPVMHCDEAAGVVALTSGDGSAGAIRVFDLDTFRHLYTLLPPGLSLPSSMYAHFSGDYVACGSFSGGLFVLESIDERKKGQQQLVPIAKQDAGSSSDDDDSEAPKGGKSRKKGGKKKGAGANIADAAAAAVSMVKRSLSPVRSPRAKKPDAAAKTGQKQVKQQKGGSEDKSWIMLTVVGLVLAILGGFVATLLVPSH
jgi:hypothetical protein